MTSGKDSGKKGSAYIAIRDVGQRALISTCIIAVAYWATKSSSSSSYESHELAAIIRGDREQLSHGMISHTKSAKLAYWLKEGLPDEYTPKILWLMAWPESGEDYILETIQRVSNRSTATNYGEVVTLPEFFSIPIYPLHSEGPYWEGLAGQFENKIRRLPDRHVLTMTHCSSKCFLDCPPKEYYAESKSSFSKKCGTTTARVAPNAKMTTFQYPLDRVSKAIHVIRNPFHNVIQRFLKEREIRKDDVGFLEEYPDLPKKGFQKWCAFMDDKYEKEDAKVYSKTLLKLAKKALCHAEFYKYVQWHNNAFETTKHMKHTTVVYYEDFYTDTFEETIDKIVGMLELDRVDAPYPFSPPHDYSRFYSLESRKSIRNFVKALASDETWKHLKHFFEPGNIEA
ncbi:sulfotransferase domain-containing protein [Fragilaria crotonensis]|nr:sulfotransferase domain-containing protein [Fragilaria crotonensis]